MSAVPDGVRVTVSPVAGIAMLPAASVVQTFTNEPFAPPLADVEPPTAVIATFETPEPTMIEKTLYDSAPDRAAFDAAKKYCSP
jgi:hypothetical protein